MSGTLFRVQRFRASCTHQPVQPRFFFSLALTTLSTFHHVTICILYHHPPSSCFLLGEIPSLGSGSHDPRTFLLMFIKPRKVLLILGCVQCGGRQVIASCLLFAVRRNKLCMTTLTTKYYSTTVSDRNGWRYYFPFQKRRHPPKMNIVVVVLRTCATTVLYVRCAVVVSATVAQTMI